MKIVVATDGSRASVAALKFATRLADGNRNDEIVVLTVRSGGPRGSGSAESVLKGAARHVPERSRAQFLVAAARRSEDVPDAIAREADRLKADVIVIGSKGRDSLSEWIVGGTALRLIYVARRPVTVVRGPRSRMTR